LVAIFSGDGPLDLGILLADVWDDLAIVGFDAAIDFSVPHCPVLAVQEGYSCTSALSNRVGPASYKMPNLFYSLLGNILDPQ
jgi:hypothetical protein